jgi:hypothetical protein
LPAPIAIFVYKRDQHTRRLLSSLQSCDQFDQSPVTIFCEGPKGPEDEEGVVRTRRLVKSMVPHARIVERDRNLGCANSIIAGVTEVCEHDGRAIVVEDDLVFSPHALRYFNDALDIYEREERVMHVAGYMYPVRRAVPAAFFYREVTCWGWATWKRAWRHFEPDTQKSIDGLRADDDLREFDVRGSMDFWQMLNQQLNDDIDAWDIRWYASMFRRNGLALHPGKALVANKGHDGTGVHCPPSKTFDVVLSQEPLDPSAFPKDIVESEAALRAMIDYRNMLRPSMAARVRRRIGRVARRFGLMSRQPPVRERQA